MDLTRVTAIPADSMMKFHTRRYPVYNVTYDDAVFELDHILAEDTSCDEERSTVFLYVCYETNDRFCLKAFNTSLAFSEIPMILAYNNTKLDCMVSARVVHVAVPQQQPLRGPIRPKHFNAIAMHYAGPTLGQIMLPSDKILILMKAILNACESLFKHGLCYLDIKAPNICVSDDLTEIKLIDYGSITKIGRPNGVATFPPPCAPTGLGVEATESTIVYGLGVLLAMYFAPTKLTNNLRYANKETLRGASKRISDAAHDIVADCKTVELRAAYFDSLVSPSSFKSFGNHLDRMMRHASCI